MSIALLRAPLVLLSPRFRAEAGKLHCSAATSHDWPVLLSTPRARPAWIASGWPARLASAREPIGR